MGHTFSSLHRRTPHAFPTFSQTYIAGHACLAANKILVFHTEGGGGGGGGSTPICSTRHTCHFHFQNRATHFGHCPMLPSPPLNTKHSVNQPCTYDIPSNTKHSVDLYHALTPISCDVLVHMPCNYATAILMLHVYAHYMNHSHQLYFMSISMQTYITSI